MFDQTTAEHFVREMGITPDDYRRTLPEAVGTLSFEICGPETVIHHPEGEIKITLHPTTERRLGSFVIPLTRVEFSFSGLSQVERNRFMGRFDRHFQRGGG